MRWDFAVFFPFCVSCWYLQGSSKTGLPTIFVNVCYRWWNSYASYVPNKSLWFQQLCRTMRSLLKLPLNRRQTIYQVSVWLLLWSNTLVLCHFMIRNLVSFFGSPSINYEYLDFFPCVSNYILSQQYVKPFILTWHAVSVTGRKLNFGFTTRAKFNRLLDEGDITPQQVD